jgi:FkbM family methyltransferase
MFSSFADISVATRLANCKSSQPGSEIPLHPKALGGKAIYCRPGTTDWATFLSAFENQYHLPPEQCNQFSCIVDLGTNVGYTAAHFAYLYPQAQVIAIEMDSENYKVAKENVRPWKDRISLVHAAIWNSDCEVTYNSCLPQDAYKIQVNRSGSYNEHTKTVSAISMNSLIRRFNIERIDYSICEFT